MSTPCRVLKGSSCEITQYYGGSNNHLGIDIVGKGYTLDTIKAHTAGKVVYLQTGHKNNKGSSGNASYGNMVKLDHGNGWFTLYAHMDKVYVGNGQQVSAGQEIGYMGNTGNSYGGHLHFEVWKNSARTNPLNYLDKDLFSNVTSTVKREENKDQLKVLADDLRVRKGAGTNQAIIGLAKLNGIYNYYETKISGGYTWYRIADGQWIAYQNGWAEIYPKKDDEEEKKIVELNNTIDKQKAQIKALEEEKNAKIKELEDKITYLEKENTNLTEEEKKYKTFVAQKEDNYFIKLNENEKIIYKKI